MTNALNAAFAASMLATADLTTNDKEEPKVGVVSLEQGSPAHFAQIQRDALIFATGAKLHLPLPSNTLG
jgi:hypothetical protein